jgi:hypothetical protein
MEQQLGNQGLHTLAHWQSKEPKRAQKSPKEPKRAQKSPKEPKRAQKNPKGTKRAQKSPKEPKRAQKSPKEPKRAQKSPKEPKRTQKNPKEPKRDQKSLKEPKRIQKSPKGPKRTPKNPKEPSWPATRSGLIINAKSMHTKIPMRQGTLWIAQSNFCYYTKKLNVSKIYYSELYAVRTIITRGLYAFKPLLEVQKRFLRVFFY